MRFGSLKVTALLRTWSTLQGRPLGRLQRLSRARIKTDLILCTEPPKGRLTESADRSIALRAESVALGHRGRHGGLDKQCLLIEVRSQHEEDRAFTPGPLRSSEHCSRTRFSTFLFLAAFLHCLQDFVGAVEALGVCVPDPLHQLLWSVVFLGGCGYLLLLGRKSHARQVLQEGLRVEVAKVAQVAWVHVFVLLCWVPSYRCSYLPTAPNAKNQAADLESLFDPYSPDVGSVGRTLERLHNLLGALEAFGGCVPDLGDHVLRSTVARGGLRHRLLRSREGSHASQVILDCARLEVAALLLSCIA